MNHFKRHFVDVDSVNARTVIATKLIEEGIFTFQIPKLIARQQMLYIASLLGDLYFHADSDADGITIIAPKEIKTKPGTYGFSRETLSLHTDCSSVASPPDLIMICCYQAAKVGGETLLVDMREVYHDLLARNPADAHNLSKPYSILFGSGQTRYAGSIFETINEYRKSVRFRTDGGSYTDIQIIKSIDKLIEIIANRSFKLKVEDGQGYVINNGRWLHGRTAFSGNRELMRAFINVPNTASNSEFLQRGFIIDPAMIPNQKAQHQRKKINVPAKLLR